MVDTSRIVILDDYLDVSLQSADWASLPDGCENFKAYYGSALECFLSFFVGSPIRVLNAGD